MIAAAKTCLDVIKDYVDKIEQAIKTYYSTEVKETVEDQGCEYVEIDEASQFSQLMTPIELFIQPLSTKIVVGLYFTCDWDEESGIGIRFDTQGNIIRIGTGEIIY